MKNILLLTALLGTLLPAPAAVTAPPTLAPSAPPMAPDRSQPIQLPTIEVSTTRNIAPAPTGPPPSGEWLPITQLWDDFKTASLDENKWYNYDPGWEGHPFSSFMPANVQVSGNGLDLLMRSRNPLAGLRGSVDPGNVCTGCVVSKVADLYGYFEVKARAMVDGHSAFRFFTPPSREPENQYVEEMDVFDIDSGPRADPRTLSNSVRVWSQPGGGIHPWARQVVYRAPQPLTDDYHIYGFEWTPETIKASIDGAVYANYSNTSWHAAAALVLANEAVKGSPAFRRGQSAPGSFAIAYVHAWRHIGDNLPLYPNDVPPQFPNPIPVAVYNPPVPNPSP